MSAGMEGISSHIREFRERRRAGSLTIHFDGEGRPSKCEVRFLESLVEAPKLKVLRSGESRDISRTG